VRRSRSCRSLPFAVAALAVLGATRLDAQSAPPPDPAARGPLLVTEAALHFTRADGHRIDFSVHLPAAAAAPLPVVVFVHGWSAFGRDYSWIADHLASRGFAVAVYENEDRFEPDVLVWSDQAIETIDELARAAQDPKSPVFGQLDMARLGVMGHSYGGATTLVTTARDPRVKVAVALEPGTEETYHATVMAHAAQVTVPVQVQGGAYDQVVPAAHWAHPAFDRIPAAERLYVEIARAEHSAYANFDVGPLAFQLGAMPPAAYWPLSWPLFTVELHPIASRYFTSWLEKYLAGLPDPAGWTDGTRAAADLGQGILSDYSRP